MQPTTSLLFIARPIATCFIASSSMLITLLFSCLHILIFLVFSFYAKVSNVAHVPVPINNNSGKKKSFSPPVFASHINNTTDDIRKNMQILYILLFFFVHNYISPLFL